ncbi:unnamed protein product, partial [Lepidochelys kempii]
VDMFLDFSKAFDTVSHSILNSKLKKYGLDEWTIRWIESWLDYQAQWVVINGSMSSWQPVSMCGNASDILSLFIPARNGEQVRIICKDNKYDFSLQETWDLKEVITIKAIYGDEILVECNFQTLDRTEITFVAMEGMIAMNYVEWNNETIKTAEKAAKEADQIVMIKTTD